MVAGADFFGWQFEVEQPLVAEIAPVGKPFQIGAGLAEKLKFHLFEFASAEGEVAGGYFIAERFADLGNAEWNLAACGALNVFEIDKDALCSFRPQKSSARLSSVTP